MKKIILSVSCLIASSLAFAGGGSIKKINANEDGALSNGFYLNLGASFLNTTVTEATLNINSNDGSFFGTKAQSEIKSQSLGLQPSLEIGNQWYFYNNDQIGIGLRASWLQFGYSSFSDVYYKSVKGSAFNLNLLKVSPQFTYAIDDRIAFDATFTVAPTFLYLSETETGTNFPQFDSNNKPSPTVTTTRDGKVGNFTMGATYAPGLRVRFKFIALGFDYTFGTLKGSATMADGQSDSQVISQKVSGSRIYLGFQF